MAFNPNEWSNKRILNIRPEKVTEDITNFPVLVHLGQDSGVSNFDATDVFDALNNPTVVSGSTVSGTYDDYTKLLLHMDGDQSNSQHTITVNGNPDLYATGKFGGSMYFDGTGDYLTIPDSSDWYFGSGDFTIDFWVEFVSSTSSCDIVGQIQDGNNFWKIYLASDSTLRFLTTVGGVDQIIYGNSAHGMVIDTWYHICVVRNGTAFTTYVNGASTSSTTSSYSIPNFSGNLNIGYVDIYSSDIYIDELRISKGIARWTSNFTSPTEPYTSDPYTKLLLHFDGDQSNSEHALTFNGNPQIYSSEGKFNGSINFDGTGDYLSIPDSSDWDFSSGNFSVDAWINVTAFPGVGSSAVIASNTNWAANQKSWMCGLLNVGGTYRLYFLYSSDGSGYTQVYTVNTSMSTGVWYHVAYIRDNTNFYFFLNGISISINVGSVSGALHNSTAPMCIGSLDDPGDYYNGYIDELRISKGIARWTSNFTPPTGPYGSSWDNRKKIAITTNISNEIYDPYTKLMLHMDGGDTSASGHSVTVNGNPQLYATGKFGGSMYFDGTGDYLILDANNDWNFGADDFTIDFWVKSSQTTQYATLVSKTPSSFTSGMWSILTSHTNAGDIGVYFAEYSTSVPLLLTGGSLFNTDEWVHIALVRDTSSWDLYVNGVSEATATSSITITDLSAQISLGRDMNYVRYFNGYIDEFRISKGIARWATGFTIPTQPYESDYYTKLLLNFDGDESSSNHSITFNGNPQLTVVSGINGAYHFDGTGDYLSLDSSIDWNFGTDDFTLEAMVMLDSITSAGRFIARGDVTGTTGDWAWGVGTVWGGGTKFNFADYSGGVTDHLSNAVTVSTGVWHHVSIVRDSGTLRFFLDGVSVGTASCSHALNSSDTLYIGARDDSGRIEFLSGYMDELRISKGIARWTSNFIPPTSKYQGETGEVLLPVEIEYWDHTNEEAWLWTKIPTVSSGIETTLYLYYDVTQSGSSYVGDIGEVVSQNVWDNNFGAVYHMSQDPSGGTGSIKDSTANNNIGTPNGSMTSADLVDGKTGKALDFDGGDDGVTIDNSVSLNATVFTIEGVIRPTSVASTFGIIQHVAYSGPSDNGGYALYGAIDTTGEYSVVGYNNAETRVEYIDTETNTWKYIVGTYDDADMKIYMDGDLKNTSNVGASKVRSSQNYYAYISNPGISLNGIGDEIRISNVARSDAWVKASYYSNFDNLITFYEPVGDTVWANKKQLTIDSVKIGEPLVDFPILVNVSSGTGTNSFDMSDVFTQLTPDTTSSETYDAYTKLYLPFDGDQSDSQHTITVNGNPDLYATGKFGGSMYFDGNGDYLSIPDSADWNFGSGDFTIDFWYKPIDASRYYIFAGGDTYCMGIDYHFQGTRNVNVWASSTGSSWDLIDADPGGNGIGSISLNLNDWNHIAWVRSGNNWMTFVNGVKDVDITVAGSIYNASGNIQIGEHGGGYTGFWLKGYIDEFRISKGIARWTTSFSGSLPSAPYTTDSDTVLLMHFDGDKSNSGHTVDFTNGNMQLRSDIGRFDGSYYFNGSSSLTLAASQDWNLSESSFTVDWWEYRTSNPANGPVYSQESADIILGMGNGGTDIQVYLGNGSTWNLIAAGSMGTYVANTWIHRAFSYDGTTYRGFENGAIVNEWAVGAMSDSSSRVLEIGDNGGYKLNGYLSDLRLSKGIARWTSNFIPPECRAGTDYDNRRKLTVTTDVVGEEVYLFSEIERWECNSEAWLWTRIPFITASGTGDTVLYLNYDKDKEDSNYTGDTLSDPAKSVWNDNFLNVWHMGQLPMHGVPSVFDSTANNNIGTPNGSMTPIDSVDGKTGKALDFDGSDDVITLGSITNTQWTAEVIAKPINYTQSGDGFIVFAGKGIVQADGYWALLQDSDVAAKGNTLSITGDFVNIVATSDGSSTYKMYENGADVSSSHSNPSWSLAGAYYIGQGYSSRRPEGIIDEVRVSNVIRGDAWIKSTYYSNWNDLITFSDYTQYFVNFVFSNPVPADNNTAYGFQHQLKINVTVSGNVAPSYTYDADFYNSLGVKVGSTVSGVNSGDQSVSTVYLPTPSGGVDYSWYVYSTASGYDDTSPIYTFTNMFLCAGYTEVDGVRASGIPIRLYRRSDGLFISETTSTGVDGTFEIPTPYTDFHYALAFHPTDEYRNLEAYDWLSPVIS